MGKNNILKRRINSLFFYIKGIEHLYVKFILTIIAVSLIMIASNLSNGIEIVGYTHIRGSIDADVSGNVDANVNGNIDADVDAWVDGSIDTY